MVIKHVLEGKRGSTRKLGDKANLARKEAEEAAERERIRRLDEEVEGYNGVEDET